MKKSVIAWTAALTLALALTGCSADRSTNSDDMGAGSSPSVNSDDPARGSAGIGSEDGRESALPTPDVNDAENGGGAGGTNDVDNDGRPESRNQANAYDQTHGGIDDEGHIVDNGANNGGGVGGTMDDVGNAVGDAARGIGNGVGDVARGAGNAIRDAGNAVGDAVTGR